MKKILHKIRLFFLKLLKGIPEENQQVIETKPIYISQSRDIKWFVGKQRFPIIKDGEFFNQDMNDAARKAILQDLMVKVDSLTAYKISDEVDYETGMYMRTLTARVGIVKRGWDDETN